MVTDEETITDEMYTNAKLHQPQGKYQTIFGIDVLPSYQHLGIATKLMKNLIEKAQKKNALELFYVVNINLFHFMNNLDFKI